MDVLTPSRWERLIGAARLAADRVSTSRMSSSWLVASVAWIVGVLWIGFLFRLAGGMTVHVSNGYIFNEMLVRLLEGRFDLTSSTIGVEAFSHEGRLYAYFGIFCALLRLPLLLMGGIRAVDMTAGSIFVAASLSLAFRLGAVATILGNARLKASLPLVLICCITTVLTGETIQYLKASIYQEVVSWGAALAAGFVFVVVRFVVLGKGSELKTYALLACLAGLALLCRFSFGLGLYCALLAITALRAWGAFSTSRTLPWRSIVPTLAVLLIFAGLAGGVNYARWGNPSSFIPLELQDREHAMFPDRLPRVLHQGAFNIRRVPYGLQYYFAPIWELQRPDGKLLFEQAQVRDFEVVELPPSSLFLSDPATCLLAIVGAFALVLRPRRIPSLAVATGALIGLAIPAGAMLGALAMTFRYRMEFYPMLDFAADIGLFVLATRPAGFPKLAVPGLAACGATGAVISAATWLLYNLSPFGSATDLDLSRGWSGFYLSIFQGERPVPVGHLLPDGRRIPQIYDEEAKAPPRF